MKQDTKDHDTLIKNGWWFVPKDAFKPSEEETKLFWETIKGGTSTL